MYLRPTQPDKKHPAEPVTPNEKAAFLNAQVQFAAILRALAIQQGRQVDENC